MITRALVRNVPTGAQPSDALFHFEVEMSEAYAANRASFGLTMAGLIVVLVGVLAFVGNLRWGLAWGSTALLLHLVAVVSCRHYMALKPNSRSLVDWKRRFIAIETLYGLAFGAYPFLFPHTFLAEGLVGVDVVRFAMVIVFISLSALVAAPLLSAAVVSTLPIAVGLAAAHMLSPNIVDILVALCALGAELLFLYLTAQLNRQYAQNLIFRAEKDAAFAEIEQGKAVSDEARRRAEAANMAKSQFLATMSHELRTPLNAILGFSEVMRNEMLGPIENDAYKDYLNDIYNSGQHLLKLINEILDLSRIEAGKRELREELLSLVSVAREAKGLLDLKARQKNIKVSEHFEEDMPKIVIDEQAIRQVTLNLLANALKFTPAGGEVLVKVGRTQAGGQYISVRDNGPGIPEDELPIVLSAFGQSSISIKNAEQGTGLGIPIVQALIHLHGGSFLLRSKLGVGTEAIAILPAKRVVSAFTDDNRTWALMQAKKPARMKKAG
ncbi:HAMP domain-containing sensor histidine kinase [Afifella sp. IM 167]|uniref:sensor histidine kinase n=1 Tax=Afifella sp. IM 167 TaxID=2033586 RepID=UPI001CC978F0|nr:HAMP domain-containing sensor histidine kinase [Afifella sp. IM 167]